MDIFVMATWKVLKNMDGKGGVRYREHSTRKHGAIPDRYYVLTYWWWTFNKKGEKKKGTINEPVGWASSGKTPSECFKYLEIIKGNQENGSGPCTLKDLRAAEAAKEQAKQDRNVTLDQYWPKFLEAAKREKKKVTWEKELSHFKHWLSPILGGMLLQQIELPQWDLLVGALTKAGRSQRTKEYVTGTLRRIMKHAYERKIIDNAPPSGKRIGVKGPGESNRRRRVIRPDEAQSILDTLAEIDINAWRITYFAFLTGCRASEAFNLCWRDVDLIRGAVVFPNSKNRDSREIPLSKPLEELFMQLRPGKPEARVFVRQDAAPYKEAPYEFRRVVNVLGLNDGHEELNKISFHSIRHTVATKLAKSLSLRDLMTVMGWRTVQMAMRYVHGDEKAQRNALAGLDSVVKSEDRNSVDINRARG